MCRKIDMEEKIFTNSFMYYNKRYELLVCAPPKAGCSSMKRHLLRLAGVPETIPVHSGKARSAISVRRQLGNNLKAVLESPSATRVMVARHPLDRLVSGYRDKLNNGGPVTGQWADHLTNYRTSRGLDTGNMTMTFREYLEMVVYTMETLGRGKVNRHYCPTTLLCSPCSVHYDYIFHTDTLTEDLQFIVDKLDVRGIDLDLHLNAKTGSNCY
ncbi:carbohydrate sulfotransferase 8-like [Penaeus japonicus]|uniref:carbohydrate sulfotransferase 8-like n=1 Tax=Penaeus japonicus TaxID=27405 RepID=UPI001C70DC39|nr:carbohydrate sulfotransferase 8-like [Penaeus japonicus]